jgi:hypothetical protein
VSHLLVQCNQSPSPSRPPSITRNIFCGQSSQILVFVTTRLADRRLYLCLQPHPFSPCNVCEQAGFVVSTPRIVRRLQHWYEQPPPNLTSANSLNFLHKFQIASVPRHKHNSSLSVDEILCRHKRIEDFNCMFSIPCTVIQLLRCKLTNRHTSLNYYFIIIIVIIIIIIIIEFCFSLGGSSPTLI